MTDTISEIRRQMKLVRAAPEPFYIVLDHAMAPGWQLSSGRDAKGQNYIVVSPSVLDEMKHVKRTTTAAWSLFGIPVYRRDNMPEGWPDR